MPDSTTKATTSGTNEPWKDAQPALKQGLNEAQNLFSSGGNFQPYTGSTVVPYSDQTMAGANAIQGQAQTALDNPNSATGKPLSFYGGLYDTGGLSSQQQAVQPMLEKTASGAELNQTSPVFQSMLDKAAQDARNGVNLSMSAAGRYGSGMHTDALGRSITNAQAPMLLSNYNTELGRMDAARGALSGLGQQGIANQGMASEAMPGAWATGQLPATDLMKVGSMYEDLAGRTMGDQQRIFQETQQAPLSAVEWLNSIASGAGSLGGSQSQTVAQPAPNPFLQLLAGGVGLNSLLGG